MVVSGWEKGMTYAVGCGLAEGDGVSCMSDLVGRVEEMSTVGRRSQTISILSSSRNGEGSLMQGLCREAHRKL